MEYTRPSTCTSGCKFRRGNAQAMACGRVNNNGGVKRFP